MNNVCLIGRLARNPDTSPARENKLCVSRYTLAVDRLGGKATDYIHCVAFGKAGEFVQQYLRKGMKVAVRGALQSNDHFDKYGNRVHDFEVVVDVHEFCERKGATDQLEPEPSDQTDQEGAHNG